jgi:hypothetical protein
MRVNPREYERPELSVLGKFEELTQGASDGERLDAAFPAGTPKVDLTFS